MDKLQIANQALVEALCPPMVSLTDETQEAEFVRLRYETIFQRHAASYHWDFCRMLVALDGPLMLSDGTTVDEPPARWAFRYPFPTDPKVLAVTAVLVNDRAIEYGIFGEEIWTDADARVDPIILDYLWRAPEETWPPFFVSTFVLMLASAIAGGVREDLERASMLKNDALAELRTARFTSAKQRPSRPLRRGLLARLRVSR